MNRLERLKVPWNWSSRISDHLLWQGLRSISDLFVGCLLDIGCGQKPYQRLLGRRVERWVGLDLATTFIGPSSADVIGSAMEIPFKACAFDTLLSTQVLEHVPRPEDLLREAHRVLRPGGHLIVTAPQTDPLHEEPQDFFRYTSHGLRYLAERAGLQVLRISPLGGAFATVGQMILWHSNWLKRMPGLGPLLHGLVNAVSSRAILNLDKISHLYGRGAMKDTLNWLMVTRKDA